MSELVTTSHDGPVAVVTIERPERRNAVDSATASALADAIEDADADPTVSVLVLTGAGRSFCAGADLQALAAGDRADLSAGSGATGRGPMGPTRLRTAKPVVAAIEGPAVAGGLELALWADLRVAASDATFGVYCRRFGVPLVDLGTVRLPRLIGHSRAMDLILTGRGIDGVEAERIGLVNRVTEPGEALTTAVLLAHDLAALPQTCLRNDRASAIEQWDLSWDDATAREWQLGVETITSGETLDGAARFSSGSGRHGAAATPPISPSP
ncbi:crotonase/enoyl-CoA hydratase family protein [Nocardioides sp. C4-1]|uniref:crotonase/enoyl-CoA hydratase family protein n=1 Tax=Nocardioides sp. C4-1 TaxID=3151851 RepID=UPI0032637C13